MERAVILLRNTTLSIEEIGTLIGYSDHSNFYKTFKDFYGMTPRDYLAEYAEGKNSGSLIEAERICRIISNSPPKAIF